MKITAKDFFLHIAVVVLLYAGIVAMLNILFRVINVAFPTVSNNIFYNSSSISFPVATLIVVFPLFLFLTNLLRKGYAEEPAKKEYAVRKWLIYITIFIAGGVLAGDLITLIYFFLDGQDLTIAFLLKILSVLVVIGAVFGYFVDDLKDRLIGSRRNLWRTVATILVVGSILIGFGVLGTPQTQRMLRYDSQKIADLQNIQWQVVNYWQLKKTLPSSLSDLNDPISGFNVPLDPQTKMPYEFKKTGPLSFDLCATFNKPSQASNVLGTSFPEVRPMEKITENWTHETGNQCFSRIIDPELYPVRLK